MVDLSGTALSILSLLGLNVFQSIKWWITRRLRERESLDLVAMKSSMVQLRAMLTEACDNDEVANTEKMKQFIRHVGHQVRATEHFVDAMLKAHGAVVDA